MSLRSDRSVDSKARSYVQNPGHNYDNLTRTDVRKKLRRRPYRTIAPISKVLISESIADIMRRHRHPCHCHYIVARVSRVSHLPAWRQRELLSLVAFIIIYLQLACASIDTSSRTHDAITPLSLTFFTHVDARACTNACRKHAFPSISCTLMTTEKQFIRLFVWKTERVWKSLSRLIALSAYAVISYYLINLFWHS